LLFESDLDAQEKLRMAVGPDRQTASTDILGQILSTLAACRPYPTACSPQAWSTGAPLLLLRTMLGLEPTGEHLLVDPALPKRIGHLELLDIPGRWGVMDAFGRGRVDTEQPPPRRRQR
jgi:hypothetical protein